MIEIDSLEKIWEDYQADINFTHLSAISNFVPGEGNKNASLFFIGEAPGVLENELKRPFVGKSGKLLTSCLLRIGLARSDVWITNVVKYRPPGNRDPHPFEIEASTPFLRREIKIIKPKILVPLGRIALDLIVPGARIGTSQGQLTYTANNFPVFPLFHPSYVLRGGERTKEMYLQSFERLLHLLQEKEVNAN